MPRSVTSRKERGSEFTGKSEQGKKLCPVQWHPEKKGGPNLRGNPNREKNHAPFSYIPKREGVRIYGETRTGKKSCPVQLHPEKRGGPNLRVSPNRGKNHAPFSGISEREGVRIKKSTQASDNRGERSSQAQSTSTKRMCRGQRCAGGFSFEALFVWVYAMMRKHSRRTAGKRGERKNAGRRNIIRILWCSIVQYVKDWGVFLRSVPPPSQKRWSSTSDSWVFAQVFFEQ